MEDLLNQIGLPLIAVVVPIIMIGVKWLLPRLPAASIPLLAGVLGPALDWALAALASVEASDPTVAALVGLAGVGLREVVDQIRKTMKKHEGRVLASPFATAAAIALLGLSAGGCSSMLPQMAPIMGAAPGGVTSEAEAEGEEGAAWLDKLADGIVKADTAAGRAVRVCLFSAVAAELYTFRLDYYGADLDEKSRAYGSLTRLASSVARLESETDSGWFETRIFYASVGLLRAVEGPLRDRVLGGITDGLSANWVALARGLRQGIGQAWLADAMFRDVRRMAAGVEKDAGAAPAAWASCKGRIQGNLEILAGAIGTEAPKLLRLGS